jgi:hypothetical protein
VEESSLYQDELMHRFQAIIHWTADAGKSRPRRIDTSLFLLPRFSVPRPRRADVANPSLADQPTFEPASTSLHADAASVAEPPDVPLGEPLL